MVQNTLTQNIGQYGSVNKIGMTQDGRVIYQITGPDGYEAGKISIQKKDCDTFEKSYNDIMKAAPKLEKYAKENSSPEIVQHKQKVSRWIIGLSGLTGGIIPAATTGKMKKWHQWALTIGGTIAGLLIGLITSYAVNTPSGMRSFSKATENLSKIDIQPVQESTNTVPIM